MSNLDTIKNFINQYNTDKREGNIEEVILRDEINEIKQKILSKNFTIEEKNELNGNLNYKTRRFIMAPHWDNLITDMEAVVNVSETIFNQKDNILVALKQQYISEGINAIANYISELKDFSWNNNDMTQKISEIKRYVKGLDNCNKCNRTDLIEFWCRENLSRDDLVFCVDKLKGFEYADNSLNNLNNNYLAIKDFNKQVDEGLNLVFLGLFSAYTFGKTARLMTNYRKVFETKEEGVIDDLKWLSGINERLKELNPNGVDDSKIITYLNSSINKLNNVSINNENLACTVLSKLISCHPANRMAIWNCIVKYVEKNSFSDEGLKQDFTYYVNGICDQVIQKNNSLLQNTNNNGQEQERFADSMPTEGRQYNSGKGKKIFDVKEQISKILDLENKVEDAKTDKEREAILTELQSEYDFLTKEVDERVDVVVIDNPVFNRYRLGFLLEYDKICRDFNDNDQICLSSFVSGLNETMEAFYAAEKQISNEEVDNYTVGTEKKQEEESYEFIQREGDRVSIDSFKSQVDSLKTSFINIESECDSYLNLCNKLDKKIFKDIYKVLLDKLKEENIKIKNDCNKYIDEISKNSWKETSVNINSYNEKLNDANEYASKVFGCISTNAELQNEKIENYKKSLSGVISGVESKYKSFMNNNVKKEIQDDLMNNVKALKETYGYLEKISELYNFEGDIKSVNSISKIESYEEAQNVFEKYLGNIKSCRDQTEKCFNIINNYCGAKNNIIKEQGTPANNPLNSNPYNTQSFVNASTSKKADFHRQMTPVNDFQNTYQNGLNANNSLRSQGNGHP